MKKVILLVFALATFISSNTFARQYQTWEYADTGGEACSKALEAVESQVNYRCSDKGGVKESVSSGCFDTKRTSSSSYKSYAKSTFTCNGK